jgi:uncharacterized membrane protein
MPYRAIAALAAVGLADTAYLTAIKLLHVAPTCPLNGGCADILTSEYATLFGMFPLSAAGMLAYGAIAALAWQGVKLQQRKSSASGGSGSSSDAAAEADAPMRTGVLAGGLAMASCSSVLLYILATRFPGQVCPWCLTSAAASFGIAVAAASGLRPRELQDAAGPGAGVVAATLLIVSLGLGLPNGSFASGDYDLDYAQPVVTNPSPAGALSLAQRLRDGGARMYGAFWCSHCYDQKQTFGEEAMAAFPYVECYPEGLHKVGGCGCFRAGGAAAAGSCCLMLLLAAVACCRCLLPLLAAVACCWCWCCRLGLWAPTGGWLLGAQLLLSPRAHLPPCLAPPALPPCLQDTQMAEVCKTAPGGLTGFPTWVIGGEQLVGEQTFEQLEAALAKLQAAAPSTATAASS